MRNLKASIKTSCDDQGRIQGFQLLRAVCCLGILLAHSCYWAEINFDTLQEGDLMYPGRLGMLNYVVFFFVLSGFLISKQILSGYSDNPWSYLSRRFWSLYPFYWISLSVVIGLRLICFNELTVANTFWQSYFLLPGNVPYLCSVEWTLTLQVVFYLFAAPFFFKAVKKAFPAAVLLMIGFIAFVKCGIINVGDCLFRYIITGYDALLWILLGATMYFVFYIVNRWNPGGGCCFLHGGIGQTVLILASAGLVAIITRMIGPYTVGTFFQYMALYVLIFITLLLLSKISVHGNAILSVVAKHSLIIYLIHSNLLNCIFFELNKRGVHYSIAIHLIVLLFTLLVLIGFSSVIRPGVYAIRDSAGKRFGRKK